MGNVKKRRAANEEKTNLLTADTIENTSLIRQSGNSDVDVQVKVDTTPIAFAMLCSLLASKQLSQSEFDSAVRKLKRLSTNSGSKNGNKTTKKKDSHRDKSRRRRW
ncbi:hypothetical protein SAMN05216389_10197 [Oceanobacillus limi]|uniref:Uncharacterized protein n=1 Tax=Oceanobacillus limi TaxID=930131 RepID=A0A1H9Y0F6_9BACI|nr:hypothetical protein [Oceanobacillus limi]SES62240.1 hypothetical protein SAMN05216389_10197 [Oceanobacillus limi]